MSLAQVRRIRRLERKMAAPEQWSIPLDPVEMAQEAGLVLDEWQERVVRSSHHQILLNVSRQAGKSTSAAVLAVHTVLSEPNALALLVSKSLRQSGELFRACMSVYRALGRPIRPRQESALRLELRNGSRIVSLPGKDENIRGFPNVQILILDESSRIPDQLYYSVRPMLAVSRGRVMLLSTPFGDRGHFFEAYCNRHEWDYFEVPAEECPRISPEWLQAEKETIGDFWFEQEYHCKFLSS